MPLFLEGVPERSEPPNASPPTSAYATTAPTRKRSACTLFGIPRACDSTAPLVQIVRVCSHRVRRSRRWSREEPTCIGPASLPLAFASSAQRPPLIGNLRETDRSLGALRPHGDWGACYRRALAGRDKTGSPESDSGACLYSTGQLTTIGMALIVTSPARCAARTAAAERRRRGVSFAFQVTRFTAHRGV